MLSIVSCSSCIIAGVVNERPGVPDSCWTARNSPRFDPAIDLLLDVVDARLAERSLQRVTQDGALFHDGFALQIAIARERDGLPRDIRRLTFVLHVMRALGARRLQRPSSAGSRNARRAPGAAAASPRATRRAWLLASGAPRSARQPRPVDPLRPGSPRSADDAGWRRRGTRGSSRRISG